MINLGWLVTTWDIIQIKAFLRLSRLRCRCQTGWRGFGLWMGDRCTMVCHEYWLGKDSRLPYLYIIFERLHLVRKVWGGHTLSGKAWGWVWDKSEWNVSKSDMCLLWVCQHASMHMKVSIYEHMTCQLELMTCWFKLTTHQFLEKTT